MRRILTALGLALLLPTVAAAQTTAPTPPIFTPTQRAEIIRIIREALKSDPSILREAVGALQADEGMREESAAHAAIGLSRQELLHDSRDAVAGNPSGNITIVEFYDVRCPYCRHMEPVIDQLLQQNPHVRLVLKDMPVLGAPSRLGARALLAAERQGGYLKLFQRLMRSAPPTQDALKDDAGALGLDWPRMQRDMEDPAIQDKIDANLALARRLHIEGTPAFIVGDRLIPGEVELVDLKHAISAAHTD